MGKIKVTIQEVNRLAAINNLSEAIRDVARALWSTPQVTISGCVISNTDTAINIDTEPEVKETKIMEFEDNEIDEGGEK